MVELPIFPLGTVLVPHGILPLHVFEDRYRVMMRRCLDGDRRFGIVLIERGSEVGGDDTRTSVGTIARILEARELPDGRWLTVVAGERRLRVTEWLPDDPHPRALIEEVEEPAAHVDPEALLELQATVRRIAALLSEMGEPGPPVTLELADDPVAATFQAIALTPLNSHDAQSLLETEDPTERLGQLADHLEGIETSLQLRLRM